VQDLAPTPPTLHTHRTRAPTKPRDVSYDRSVRTADFEYELPEAAIAQQARPRGCSRLLVLDRSGGGVRLVSVRELPALLRPDDLMLVNDVRVIPARLRAWRPGGGAAELLLVRPLGGDQWEAMARPAKRLRPGVALALARGVAVPLEPLGEGRWRVAFEPPLGPDALAAVGEVPLPPYIRRAGGVTETDRERYQTVYARAGRAVAAPTAGLHFTPELLAALADRGVEVARLTLHVGPGTFRPVQVDDPRQHRLDAEDYEVPAAAARSLNAALASGRRIVCVGTTSCRALEHSLAVGRGRVRAGLASADLLIVPGHCFRGTGALLTNFHLPRSSLLMLVSALAGRERVLAAYALARATGFHFYSYGDAMLVL
jgi:S-adenosylmethionine:tRNA ribosyltransferase-isomerase